MERAKMGNLAVLRYRKSHNRNGLRKLKHNLATLVTRAGQLRTVTGRERHTPALQRRFGANTAPGRGDWPCSLAVAPEDLAVPKP
jgi:hypothetical protein